MVTMIGTADSTYAVVLVRGFDADGGEICAMIREYGGDF